MRKELWKFLLPFYSNLKKYIPSQLRPNWSSIFFLQTLQNFRLISVRSDQTWATGFLTSVAAILTQGSATVFKHFSWTIMLQTEKRKRIHIIIKIKPYIEVNFQLCSNYLGSRRSTSQMCINIIFRGGVGYRKIESRYAPWPLSSTAPIMSHYLKTIYYMKKMEGLSWQWNKALMINRHQRQLKK